MSLPGGFIRWALALAPALAATSLLLPFAPAFDPWAWLVWGREITAFELDTSAGASFKPLTVGVGVLLAPLGDAAPELWLLLARTGWLLAIALTARLAWRFARSAGCEPRAAVAAGLLAAFSLILLRDAFTPWLRQFATGLSEPLLVAAVLGSIEAHLGERRRLAFGLLLAASLLRPEAWPFIAGYAAYLWREGDRGWALPVGLAAIPVLWLLPDLLGSGSPLTGAERARADDEGPVTNGLEAIWRTFNLAPAALVLATIAWLAARRSPPSVRVVAALAAGWGLIVLAMALVGYPGLPRFSAPVGAVVTAIGAAGLIALADRGRTGALVAVLALALAVQAGTRVALLPGDLSESAERSSEQRSLRAVVDRLGRERLLRCGAVSTSDPLTRSALAWELERSVSGVDLATGAPPPSGTALVGPEADPGAVPAAGAPIAAEGGWTAYPVGCADAVVEGDAVEAAALGAGR